jgi:predicted RNA-binding Zn ribbon-like protein
MVTGTPYDPSGGHPALDFVNSVDRMTHRPWVERVKGYGDLLSWSSAAGTLPEGSAELARAARARPAEAAAALSRARELREALYRIFAAVVAGTSPAEADLARMNAELARALSRARVESAGGGFAWGWDVGAPELDRPLWPIVRSAAELLTSSERALVKRCASDTCLWLFLDGTKNHARRWCDMKVCGNRAKVRRHRRRAAIGARTPGSARPGR